MLKGMTAQYLLRRIHPVKAGETIVFHAAAGGVGQIACQWAKHLGATVIGTTTSPDKVELAKDNGCAHVLNTKDAGWEKKVREITGGKGVPVVYDSIGKDTFVAVAGLPAAARHDGELRQFLRPGRSPFPLGILATKGSLFVTRPTLAHYTRTPQELQETADDLFAVIAVRRGEGRDQPALCAEGRGQGAGSAGRQADHRRDGSDSVRAQLGRIGLARRFPHPGEAAVEVVAARCLEACDRPEGVSRI